MIKQNKVSSLIILLIILCSIGLLIWGLHSAITSRMSFGADFSIYWNAGKALFTKGISPYDESVTEAIQMGIYGRLAAPDEDQVRYAYPPFSLISILPTAWMNYPWAQAYWMAFNLVLIFVAVLVLCKKPPLWLLAGLVFFYPISRGIILGQFALLIGSSFIIAYSLAIHPKNPTKTAQWLGGILFAWTAMKPHLVALLLIFVFLAAIKKKCWRVLTGFGIGAAALAGVSWLMVPTWVSDWYHLITDYVGYVPNKPILGEWLSMLQIEFSSLWVKGIFLLFAAAIAVWLIKSWWNNQIPDYLPLAWLALSWELVSPNPNSLLSDHIIFLLPILLWMMDLSIHNNWKKMSWGLFILVPWVLFFIYFKGLEPYEVSSGLAGLFAIWILTLVVVNIRKMRIIDRKN